MEDKAKCGASLYWHNCYSGGFSLWSENAYSHPAKMSPALCYRILQHLQELGLVKEGDTILDPMAGIGTTNVCAGAMGFKSISVELEEKFVNFQKENKEYAERRLYKPLDWTMLKGDSRRLSDLLKGQDLKSITSPPYEGESSTHNRDRQQDIERMIRKGMKVNPDSADAKVIEFDYGKTEGQIGGLKDVPLKSITSPPYQDSQGHPSLGSVNKDDWGKEGKDIVKRRGLSGEYGDTEGQVGKLKSITSPPYEESLPNGLDRKAAEQMVQAMYDKHGRTYSKEDFEYQVELILKRSNREYGETEGQIGKLKDKPLKSIVSPPYANRVDDHGVDQKGYEGFTDKLGEYGDSEGQIGKLKDKPLKSIVSPPYSEAQSGGGIAKKGYTGSKHSPTDLVGNRSYMPEIHGQSKGQIANLKDTPLKSIVSPPYGETGVGDWKTGRAEFQAWVINEIKTKGYVEWQGKRYNEAEWRAMNHGRIDGRTTKGVHKHPTDGYSDNPDNIGGLPDKPLKVITSPPYGDAELDIGVRPNRWDKIKDNPKFRGRQKWEQGGRPSEYSSDPNNLGNLPDKPLKASTSPPYEQSITGGKSGIEWQEEWGKPSESRQPSQDISYGESKENIGNLKDTPLKAITSPPYGDAEKRDRSKEPHYEKEKDYPRGDHNISAGYQGSDDNIWKLADKPLKTLTSPPYMDSDMGKVSDEIKRDSPRKMWNDGERYGQADGQIGNEKQESYLQAMLQVYREIALVSDCLTVVVKNPTRNGKIRRLDLDTIAILEASNWKVHCQHRALLFEELEQADMFEGSKKQVKGRLSFFKRLSYIKGQPVSSWEDIIICVRK